MRRRAYNRCFGIPGAKIDKVFDSLLDSSIRIIPVRHEANAAFMAAAVGRITGKAGVALVTSGPGCSNLITGMATANSEGDPVVALGGAVKRADKAKQVHQSMDTVAMFSPVTKYSVEVTAAEALAEVVSNAFRRRRAGTSRQRLRQPAAGRGRRAGPRQGSARQRCAADRRGAGRSH
ncbi:acetolactate synthase [Klebsiella michiganensis]|nr:acetolactate synthase [Klebsiella michiganensis]